MKNAIYLFFTCGFIACFFFYVPVIDAQEKIIIAGTGDSQKLLRDLAAGFEQNNPGGKIEVPESIGSTGGIRSTAMGRSKLGRVARPIREKEKKYGLSYKLFAYSPVVFAVNRSVKGVDNLTFEQIIGIYSGRVKRWEELGGKKGKIYIVNREKGDSTRSSLEKNIPGFKEIKQPAGEIIYSTPEAVQILTENQNTIGYAPLAMVKGTDLKVLRLNGIEPTQGNVQKGIYVATVSLGLVWKGQLDGLAAEFIDYLFSSQAQRIISEYGAVPVTD